MKWIVIFFMCLMAFTWYASPSVTAAEENVICCDAEYLGEGLSVKERITLQDADLRGMSRAVSKYREYTYVHIGFIQQDCKSVIPRSGATWESPGTASVIATVYQEIAAP